MTRAPGSRLSAPAIAVGSVLIVLLSAGCGPPAGVSASGRGWEATLTWSPPVLSALRPTAFTLTIRNPDGSPHPLGALEATAVMASMGHRGEPVSFRETGPGRYEAVHSFSMDGEWVILVRGSAAAPMRATFRLVVGGR